MDPTDSSDDDALIARMLAPESDTPEPDLEADDQAPEPSPEDQDEPDPSEDAPEDDDEASADDPDEPASEDEEPADLYDLVVDGVTRKATLDELKQWAVKAEGADKRFREAAELRKQSERLAAEAAEHGRQMLALREHLEQHGLAPEPKAPPESLAQTNPAAYVQALARYQAQAQAWQAQRGAIEAAAHRQAQIEAHQRTLALQEAAQALISELPEFKDPTYRARLRDTGMEAYGFRPEEMEAITDPRTVKVLRDALQWREHQAKLTAAKATRPLPTPKPRNVPPAAKRNPEPPQLAHARVIERARKTGSEADWIAALLEPQKPRR